MNKTKLLAYGLTFGLFSLMAVPAFAQAGFGGTCPEGMGASDVCNLTLPGLIKSGIQFILIIAFLLSFLFLVYGGIKWIMSGGDKAGTESAKGTVTAALVGLVVVLISWAFINFVGNFFKLGNVGVDNLNTIQIKQK